MAKNTGKVRPPPQRRPRSEQYTGCPRCLRPEVSPGSLPNKRLCLFNESRQPQWGQDCRLSEKAPTPKPPHYGQSDTSIDLWPGQLPEAQPKIEDKDDGTDRRRNSVQRGPSRSRGGTHGTFTTLTSEPPRKIRHHSSQKTALLTAALRPLTSCPPGCGGRSGLEVWVKGHC